VELRDTFIVASSLGLAVSVSNIYIEPNVKRARTLILWSALHLGASWLGTMASFINPDPNKFMITDLLTILILPSVICAFIFCSQWVRSLIVTARYIQPAGIGYRQGWAFWSWLTPIASFWIPRRLITRPFECFAWFVGRPNSLQTNLWWIFFVASQIISSFSVCAALATPGLELVAVLDLISTILLTIAFPQWKKIVETVTAAQDKAVEKIMTQQQSNGLQG
jgi:hypothetical protein